MINPHFSTQLEDIIKDYPEHLHTDPPNLSSSLITDLQQVISKDGALLALEGNALIMITPNKSRIVLTGSIMESGFVNGNSTVARFNRPNAFMQHPDTRDILVADTMNGCLRVVVYDLSRAVYTNSGKCAENRIQPRIDGSQFARYESPWDLALLPCGRRVLVADKDTLRVVDTDRGTVNTVYQLPKISSEDDFRTLTLSHDGIIAITPKRLITLSLNFTEKSVLYPHLSLDQAMGEYSGIDNFELIQLMKTFGTVNSNTDDNVRTELLIDMIGMTVFSADSVLVTSDKEQGLFVVNLQDGTATRICTQGMLGISIIFNEHEEFGCEYITKSAKLALINTTLYLYGRQNQPYIGIETMHLLGEYANYSYCRLSQKLVQNA